jgi:hypothetical protein
MLKKNPLGTIHFNMKRRFKKLPTKTASSLFSIKSTEKVERPTLKYNQQTPQQSLFNLTRAVTEQYSIIIQI